MSQRKSVITGGALELPIFKKLAGRRVILASSSPRRKDILAKLGVEPEIIPSTFAENLPKSTFSGRLADYPIATAAEKGIEVYERLVRENDRDPPDLVISADTVVIFPPERDTADGERAHGETSEILEKPINEEEQTRNLLSMSGRRAEIVTGVTIVYPTVEAPGYKLESISASTLAYFHSDQEDIIQAYVKCGEGIERAGGFAYQGLGGILIEKIEGDFDNSAGFPSTAFWRWMSELDNAGVFDDAWAS